jgi:hypothetical protein
VIYQTTSQTRVTTIKLNPPQPGFRIPAGKSRYICKIKDFPLVAGQYYAQVGISEDYEIVVARKGVHDAPFFFEVFPANNQHRDVNRIFGDLVVLQSEWWQEKVT